MFEFNVIVTIERSFLAATAAAAAAAAGAATVAMVATAAVRCRDAEAEAVCRIGRFHIRGWVSY